MTQPWYKDWKNWLVIILLIFSPTFIVGLILMWILTSWPKKTKLLLTFIYPAILILGTVIIFLTLLTKPNLIPSYNDASRRYNVQLLSTQAKKFCLEQGRCPSSVQEMTEKGYMKDISAQYNPKIITTYESVDNGKNFIIKSILSSGKEFRENINGGISQ